MHPTTSLRLASAVLLALLVSPRAARAQEAPAPEAPAAPTPEAARAEALFQEGKSLLDAGRTAEACARLAESDALDPGIGSLGLLAACHEAEGRIATAWREYKETAARARAANDERGSVALERAAALESSLPRLTVRLAHPSASVEVFRNRERLAPDALGVAEPVDPGSYEIFAHAPSRPAHRVTITVQPGAQAVVDLPDFEHVAAPPPPAQPRAAQEVTPANLGPRRTAGLVLGGVGLVGVVLGAVAGAQALAQNRESIALHDNCSTRANCDEGRALREGAFRDATLSTVGFAAGGAALVAGAVMVAIPAPKAERRTAVVPFASGNGGGAVVLGQF